MQKRKLGDLEVSALGLGCMGMSFGYGPMKPSRMFVKQSACMKRRSANAVNLCPKIRWNWSRSLRE